MSTRYKINISRVLIGIVTFVNIQSAISFIINPNMFTPVFLLTGIIGQAVIQGFGVLFLMWNIPYIVALLDPYKYSTSLIEAVIMQLIGFVGELFILLNLPPEYRILRNSIIRFILFDGVGLGFLLIATTLVTRIKGHRNVFHPA
jgi:branched-subunit amino acid transport protein